MGKVLRYVSLALGGLVVCVGLLAAFNVDELRRLHSTITLFDKDKIVHNFSHMNEMFFSAPIHKHEDGEVYNFSVAGQRNQLPSFFQYKGEEKKVDEFLVRRTTTALLVIKDDAIKFEEYYLGTKEDDLRISWSVGKSFVSALMGIAVGGDLIDIEKPVDAYVPSLRGSGYEGVSVKDVLYMSSGVGWDENYSDFFSDINKMGRALSVSGSLDDFSATLEREREPGTKWKYVSMDTHVLGMVIRAATGQTLPEYMQQKLWSKIGVESDGYWITDSKGNAFALGGLNMRTRDFARFGRLFLNNGNWEGEQIVPLDWVKQSTKPGSPKMTGSKEGYGYGYQWWMGKGTPDGEFLAVGVYGQYIYINQPKNIVIVKNSADRKFMDNIGSMGETIAFFRAVSNSL